MISEDIISKIEESLGFKLYPIVKEYLISDRYLFSPKARLQGKTTAHILKQILFEEYILLDKLKSTNEYCDMIPNNRYKNLYYHMFMEYYRKLKDNGIEVAKLI